MLGNDMIEVSLAEVPVYLREGDYYKALSDNDGDGTFSVPAGVLKADPSVGSISEARHLLASLQYWIVDDDIITESLAKYLLSATDHDETRALIDEFRVVFPFLHIIGAVISDSTATKLEHQFLLVDYIRQKRSHSAPILMHLIKRERGKSQSAVESSLQKYDVSAEIEEGNIRILMCFPKRDVRRNNYLHHAAAQNGHLDCLKYLVALGFRLDERASRLAATGGHLNILEYLHSIRVPLDIYCCRHAAAYGHLTCLQYLHSIGHPWGVHVPSHAAVNGHLDCLKFAHENGCDWNEKTCRYAAAGGHLDCLRYAREHGCPWDSSVCATAARRAHSMPDRLHESNGYLWDYATCLTARGKLIQKGQK